MNTNYQTGYFTKAGKAGKVHVVDANLKPVCGTYISEGAEFQVCANGIRINILTCTHCMKNPIVKMALNELPETIIGGWPEKTFRFTGEWETTTLGGMED